jgi:DnaJ-class molecular chaperone
MNIYVCKKCGSPRVWADTYISLNTDDVCKSGVSFCDDCNDECTVEAVDVPDDFDLATDFYEDSDDYCTTCSGSGEGMHDGTRCPACKGRGVVQRESNYEAEIDRLEYERD